MNKFKIGDTVKVSSDACGIKGWDGLVVEVYESLCKVDFGVMRLWVEEGSLGESE